MTFEILHGERQIASITDKGAVKIKEPTLMPYALYLEEGEDVDALVNNLENFYYWCATRLLTIQRVYAKEILNSIGATQRTTDKDRAMITLRFHCLSLTDIFWVREAGEQVSFVELNLYDHPTDNTFVEVALQGRQKTLSDNRCAAGDVSTAGVCPKAWVYRNGAYYLLKDGAKQDVADELLASRICDCFDVPHVCYTQELYDGVQVTSTKLITGMDYGIETREAFEVYAQNKEIDAMDFILQLDAHGYYMMNIIDYLVGNTDRHWGNWGLWMDNRTYTPVRLHDLMDFNQSFRAYDTLDGGICQTTRTRDMSQKEAAVEAVRAIGLQELKEAVPAWFAGREEEFAMYQKRLEVLREAST